MWSLFFVYGKNHQPTKQIYINQGYIEVLVLLDQTFHVNGIQSV